MPAASWLLVTCIMLIQQEWDHSHCPCCHHECKDKMHFLTCPHPDCATTSWVSSLQEAVEAWMIDSNMVPAIQQCFLLILGSHNPTKVFVSLFGPSRLHSPCCPSPRLHRLGSHDRRQAFATVASAPIHLLPDNQFSQLSMEMGSWPSHQPSDHHSLPVVPLECNPPHPRCSGPQTEVGRKLTEAILAQFELGVKGLHA